MPIVNQHLKKLLFDEIKQYGKNRPVLSSRRQQDIDEIKTILNESKSTSQLHARTLVRADKIQTGWLFRSKLKNNLNRILNQRPLHEWLQEDLMEWELRDKNMSEERAFLKFDSEVKSEKQIMAGNTLSQQVVMLVSMVTQLQQEMDLLRTELKASKEVQLKYQKDNKGLQQEIDELKEANRLLERHLLKREQKEAPSARPYV